MTRAFAAEAVPDVSFTDSASWILENNEDMNRPVKLFGAEVYKKYRIWEKSLLGDS